MTDLALFKEALPRGNPFWLASEEVAEIKSKLGLDDGQVMQSMLQCLEEYAVTPTSNFIATAVGMTAEGHLVGGVNVEFKGLPLGHSIHAEQCMISHLIQRGHTSLVRAMTCPAPCGHCRQFFRETHNSDQLVVTIVAKDTRAVQAELPLPSLLPLSFSPADLGCTSPLLMPSGSRFCCAHASVPSSVQAAAERALSLAYAPHTSAVAAVVLTSRDHVWPGVYLENAAYNPSLPPLQSAVALAVVQGHFDLLASLDGAYLFEPAGSVLSHRVNTEAALVSVCPDVSLVCVTAKLIEAE